MESKFLFPYDPYPIQIDYMNTLYESLLTCKGAILESPTGTGKTLSIICASLTYLYDKYNLILNDLNATPEPKKKICLPPSTILPHIYSLKNNLDYKERIKIVYLSRTHSQLDQFTNELKKTHWGQNNLVSLVRLASRFQLCVNSNINQDKLTIDYNCNKIIQKQISINLNKDKKNKRQNFCVFYENRILVKDEVLRQICDIEDLAFVGKKTSGCPYLGTKLGINEADIIIAPYQTVINCDIKKSLGLDLSKCHVIIDEAHNIIQAIIDCYSAEINKSQIKVCLECLNNYKDLYHLKMSGIKYYYVNLSLKFLNSLELFMQENEKNLNLKN